MERVAICAVAIFPADRVAPAEASVAEHLERVGVSAGTRIHCREIFHAEARARSPWAHVHPSDIESMLERLCTDLKALGDQPLVMTLDLASWPRELSLPDGRPWTFDEKSIATTAYQYAFGVLGHKYPNAKVRLWIDPEKTKIPWAAGRRKAESIRRVFIDRGHGAEPYELVPDIEDSPKPILIDVADIYAYTAAHARTSSGGRKNAWFQSLYNLIEPHEIAPPPPPQRLTWVEKR